MTHASDQNQSASLFAKPEDFDNPKFRREVEAADIIIALDDQSRNMEVLWGDPVSEQLEGNGTPKMIYLKIDLKGKENEWIRNEIHRLKSSSSKGKTS